MSQSDDSQLRLPDAIQQWHRASRLETLARNEVAGVRADPVVNTQLSVLKRAAAAARSASRTAREASDAGVAAGVVHQAATCARGCADACEDALTVLRALLLALDPAFKASAAPPPRASTDLDSPGPLTIEGSMATLAARARPPESAELDLLSELPRPAEQK